MVTKHLITYKDRQSVQYMWLYFDLSFCMYMHVCSQKANTFHLLMALLAIRNDDCYLV